ncbi:MAG: Uma2 family endonuclease [Candidatus Competibacteraceae bacterium]|nr:Uma2 family endonuclease [Candidatus Competibacteraceae bacterium]
MSCPASRFAFTYDDYLEWEKRQPERHAYIRGEVFAMTGTSDRHNDISLNLTTLLRQHLRGTPCRVYMADVKVRVEKADCGFYPDLQVTCAESDHADRYVKRSPILIVEVLSESTASFDLGDKFAFYQQLDSLREYVLVDQERMRVQVYRRQDGQWWVDNIGPGEQLRLDSVDLECPIETLYEDLSEPLKT